MWNFVLCFAFGMALIPLNRNSKTSPWIKKYGAFCFPVLALGSAMIVEPQRSDRMAVLTFFNLVFIIAGIIAAFVMGSIFYGLFFGGL